MQLNVRPFYCYPLSSPRFRPWNTITPDAWSWLAVTSWCFEGRVDRRWISKPLCICLSVSQVEAVQSGSTKLCSRAQQSRVTQSYELQGPNIKSTQMTVWWKLNPCSKPYPLFFLYFRIIENHIYPFCFTVCAFPTLLIKICESIYIMHPLPSLLSDGTSYDQNRFFVRFGSALLYWKYEGWLRRSVDLSNGATCNLNGQ